MYRLYIDETGNADLRASHDPNHRYLSLTGIAMNLSYAGSTAFPMMEAIKAKFFGSHPDEPVVFHRKEMVHRKRPFHALRNPAIEAAFNAELFDPDGRIELPTHLAAMIEREGKAEPADPEAVADQLGRTGMDPKKVIADAQAVLEKAGSPIKAANLSAHSIAQLQVFSSHLGRWGKHRPE